MTIFYAGNVLGTGSAASNTVGTSSGTYNAASLQFAGAGIASVGFSNGSVLVSVPSGGGAGDGGNVLAAGGSTAASTGTIGFVNSNGVSFGLNGTAITATVKTDYLTTAQPPGAYLTTAAQSDHSHGNPTLALTNLSGTTASASNGLTISLAAAAPGGGSPRPQYYAEPVWAVNGGSNALLTNITGISRRILFMPFEVNGSLTFNEMHWPMSRSTTGVNSFSMYLGVYSFSNSSRIDSVWTTSVGYSHTATASQSGLRGFEATFASTSLSPGQYVLGVMFDPVGGSTSAMNYSLMGAATGNSMLLTQVVNGADTYHTNVNHLWLPFHGRFSVTTNAMPASVPAASILAAGNASNNPLPMYWVLGTHYA